MKKICLIVAVMTVYGVSQVLACSCSFTEPSGAFNDAATVFIGRMVKGTEKHTVKVGDTTDVIESGLVEFDVREVFKGNTGKSISLSIASMKGTSCGTYGLIRGATYIVYGSKRDGSTHLHTGVCTRTGRIDDEYAKEDLKFLRNLPPKGSGGKIEGRIWVDSKVKRGGGATPMAGIPVKITGRSNGKVFDVSTNTKGDFEISNVPADVYTVEPKVPANYFLEEPSDEVTVDDLGTATTGFEMNHDGHVLGLMFDVKGRQYNGAFLHLENADRSVYGHSTGENGTFEVDGVPPGKYFLYLNLDGEGSSERKYYYPGTFQRSKATSITVGVGKTVEGIKFRLPSTFKVQTVAGQVTWSDGTPASNVEVNMLCPERVRKGELSADSSPPSVETDAGGRFVVEVFSGSQYWIEARGQIKGSVTEDRHSPSRKIVISNDISGIKVVLSEVGITGNGCR